MGRSSYCFCLFFKSKILSAWERIGCHLRQQLPGFLQQQQKQQKNPFNRIGHFLRRTDVNKKCEGERARARICKRLWSPGINFEESIPPAYVAWRAGTKNGVVVSVRQAGNRFLGSINGLQIRAQASVHLWWAGQRTYNWKNKGVWHRQDAMFNFNHKASKENWERVGPWRKHQGGELRLRRL